ncbi:erythromycin esterase family protein [Sphingomonas alpina]|uniref:Erythromycin esterase family protein n=1 Tax=Sphingomonas alpina TaxID=653931 RepID=A0A7H0LP42_9SPHN|nr:erythromycin esterase family protein [Sphingomonas alpina]QNQ11445.1 erythromycin esterase family protein [Sphingomonas alpina]
MLALTALALSVSGAPVDDAAIRAWVRERATPVRTVEIVPDDEDLTPIGKLAENARVFALGEEGHDAREFWKLRNRLFAYLVEKKGYTAIAAETGYGGSIAANDYVLGGDVDPATAARGVFSWTPGAYAENLELLNWMRAYNARRTTKRKIQFYGLEMVGCMRPDGASLLAATSTYLARVAPDHTRDLRHRLSAMGPTFNRAAYPPLSEEARSEMTVAAQDLVSLFERNQKPWISRSSTKEYFENYRLAVAARQFAANLRMVNQGRDIADAETLRWVLEREGADGRVFVFAHNMHITKWRGQPDDPLMLHSSFGELTHDYLGDRLQSVATVFEGGDGRDILGIFRPANRTYRIAPTIEGTANALLAGVGSDRYFLSLKDDGASPAASRWLTTPTQFWNLNTPDQDTLIPSAAFDGIIFIRSLTPHVPLAAKPLQPEAFPCEPGVPER